MVIQRMNNVLVKHSKVLFGAFTIIIIVSFVWFFTPGVDGSLFFGNAASDKSQYGAFYDEPVTFGDVKAASRQLSLVSLGGEPSEEQAFFFAVQKKAADQFGANVSDAELEKTIKQIPFFQEDGKFSKKAYDEFERKHLETNGQTKVDFENALRETLRVEKVSDMVSSNVIMSDAEFKNLLNSKFEKFAFRIVQFTPFTLTGEVKVQEEDLKAFFESQKENFLPPAKCSGVAAIALSADFKAEVAPETVKAYYDKNQDMFKGKDGKVKSFDAVKKEIEQRLAASMTAGAEKVMKNFRAKLQELRRTEEYKTSYESIFRAAAKECGLKLQEVKEITAMNSAPSGIVEVPALSALAALKNPGSVTNPVTGEAGVYMSLLTERIVPTDTTYEEARPRVEMAYRMEKAKELVGVFAEKFREALKKSKTPAKDLEALVKEFKGNLVAMPQAVSRIELESNPNVAILNGLLFNTQPGRISLSKKENGVELMVFVDSRTAPDAKELAEYEKNPMYRTLLLQSKRGEVEMEFQAWLRSGTRIVVNRGKNTPVPD